MLFRTGCRQHLSDRKALPKDPTVRLTNEWSGPRAVVMTCLLPVWIAILLRCTHSLALRCVFFALADSVLVRSSLCSTISMLKTVAPQQPTRVTMSSNRAGTTSRSSSASCALQSQVIRHDRDRGFSRVSALLYERYLVTESPLRAKHAKAQPIATANLVY